MNEKSSKIQEALEQIEFSGKVVEWSPYGNGHINDTFLVVCDNNGETVRYILQRMNHDIFKNPQALMENIVHVTEFIRKKVVEAGGDPKREGMTVVPAKDGKSFFVDSIGSYWRAYVFIEDAICYEKVEDAQDFYESGLAFGRFQYLLSEFDASLLHETIPDFHNTPKRFETFLHAVKKDSLNRAGQVEKEIRFLMDREKEMGAAAELLAQGKLPLRVTHNDTKLNNILMDKETKKGICVIDLDTVMPGLSIHDFGDAIRFGANTALEDEQDLSKVSLSLELFETYAKGFLTGCAGRLTKLETEMLPMGAKLMTMECGMRFLTDYLEGDTYFRIHREGHNLDRTRTQLALAADMEKKWESMEAIIRKCGN